MESYRVKAPGRWTASDIRNGDPYEVSEGHRIEALPTQTRGGHAQSLGAAVISSDPNVEHAATEAGYAPEEGTLRAPDVSVLAEEPADAWGRKAPPLAIEYAGPGQDERDLLVKIGELLSSGTRYLWVVRLVGPHRVEVYEPGVERVTKGPGELLTAEGVLANPVPVEALYEPSAAQPVVLRNLLHRLGYRDLDDVREEGRVEGEHIGLEKGRVEGERAGLEKGRVEGERAGLEKGRVEGEHIGLEKGRVEGERAGLEKGRVEGERAGLEKGRVEGQRQMVRQLLEQRFGELPAEVAARVADGTAEAVQRWSSRLFTAGSLDDVLG